MKNILVILIILAIFASYLGYNFFSSASKSTKEVNFKIETGQSIDEISKNLASQGLIKSQFAFKTYIWLRNFDKKIKAGEYKLNPSMSIWRLANQMIIGPSVKEKEIKIIEGWNSDQIAQYLEDQGLFKKEAFLSEIADVEKYSKIYDFISEDKVKIQKGGKNLEGYLFPDTYRVYTDANPEDIIKKMLDNFNLKLTIEMKNEIKKQKKSIYETIILAGIIEKEVAQDIDKSMVADIFKRRMQEGIALQSDATINYITGKKTVTPTAEDLAQESLYNTYQHRGLTPGPICNPGISAIKAVIYPKINPDWYFLTDKDGNVIYSKTFDEHKANKLKYIN